MSVNLTPLLGPRMFSILLDEHFDIKSFESKSGKIKGREINVSLYRGFALFELTAIDLRRERSKEIILLLAGGLLVLGVGCLVDLTMKLLESSA
jgi:hypothetical protein